jgi:hypothetical protein
MLYRVVYICRSFNIVLEYSLILMSPLSGCSEPIQQLPASAHSPMTRKNCIYCGKYIAPGRRYNHASSQDIVNARIYRKSLGLKPFPSYSYICQSHKAHPPQISLALTRRKHAKASVVSVYTYRYNSTHGICTDYAYTRWIQLMPLYRLSVLRVSALSEARAPKQEQITRTH